MNLNVRKITEGAMIAALYGVILILNRQFGGLIETMFFFFMPIPFVVYSARYGFKSSLAVCAAVFFLAFMFALPQTLFYLFTAMMAGISYGSLVRRQVRNGILLWTVIFVAIFSQLITTVVLASFFGYDLALQFAEIGEMLSLLDTQLVVNIPENLGFFMMTAVILIGILTGILEGMLVHMISNILLSRLKIEVRPFRSLSQWRIPRWLGYFSFIAFSSRYLLNYVKIEIELYYLVQIISFIGQSVLLFFGYIATVVLGMVKYKKNLSPIILLVCFMFPAFVILPICGLGFLYITTDFRQKIVRRNNE